MTESDARIVALSACLGVEQLVAVMHRKICETTGITDNVDVLTTAAQAAAAQVVAKSCGASLEETRRALQVVAKALRRRALEARPVRRYAAPVDRPGTSRQRT